MLYRRGFMIQFSKVATRKFALCFGSLLLLSASSPQDPSQDVPLLRRIRDYWKEGDYVLAKKQIRIALDKYPTGTLAEELHLLLGDLYMQDGNFLSALEEYQSIQKEDLIEQSVYNKAICLYETKRAEELFQLSQSLSDYSNHLNKNQIHQIHYLCAVSLYQQGKPETMDSSIELFESCLKTEWATQSLAPLAQLYLQKNDKKKAIFCLKTLAKVDPSLAPDLLFKAGLLTAESEPAAALELFDKVLHLPSSQKGLSAYNCLILQYEMQQFDKVVLTYEEYQGFLNPEQKITAIHLLGKSLYELKDYKKAPTYLLSHLDALPLPSQKNMYAMAFECAYQTANIELYQELLQKASSLYQEKDVPAQFQLAFLDLLQASKYLSSHIEQSEKFLAKYPEHEQKAKVLLSLGHSLYEANQWKAAEDAFRTFLESYPHSEQKNHLLRLIVNCAGQQVKESSEEALCVHRRHWLSQMQNVLDTPLALSAKEKELMLLELTRGLFQEGDYAKALVSSEELLVEFPDIAQKEELDLIQTICHLKDPESQLIFVLSAEKLLNSYPQIEQADSLRLQLFNTYLQLSEDPFFADKEDFQEKAAEHLYMVFEKKNFTLKAENIHWLAEYYEKTATTAESSSLKKAIILYETLFAKAEPALQEKIAYRLCKLLSLSSNYKKIIDLLNPIVLQISAPETSFQKHLLLEFAGAHQIVGNAKEALDLYNTLICHCGASQIGSQALLQRSKIIFSTLTTEEKMEENVLCLEVLDNLKDLELRKDPLLFPLYLEAGLDYVEYKTSLIQDPELKKQKKIQLITLFQENNAPLSDAYQTFVDAYLLQCKEGSCEALKELQQNLQENPQINQRIESILRSL